MEEEVDKEFVDYINRSHANGDLPILLKKLDELMDYHRGRMDLEYVISNTNLYLETGGRKAGIHELYEAIEGIIEPV